MKCLCLFLPHTYNLVCKISSVNAHSANLGHSDLVLGLPVTLPVPILCQKYYAKWYKLGVLRADMKCLCLFLPHTCNLVCKIWSANTYLTNLEHSALVLPLPVTLPVPTLCKKYYAKWYNLGVLRAEMKCLYFLQSNIYNLVCKISNAHAHTANLEQPTLVLHLPVTFSIDFLLEITALQNTKCLMLHIVEKVKTKFTNAFVYVGSCDSMWMKQAQYCSHSARGRCTRTCSFCK